MFIQLQIHDLILNRLGGLVKDISTINKFFTFICNCWKFGVIVKIGTIGLSTYEMQPKNCRYIHTYIYMYLVAILQNILNSAIWTFFSN